MPVVLYRVFWMKHMRLISRFKITQTALMFAASVPMTAGVQAGTISSTAAASALGFATAATAILVAFSTISRQVVGKITFDAASDCLQVSTLTFWGNRIDHEFAASDIVPLESNTESSSPLQRSFVKINFYSHAKPFLLFPRFAEMPHPDAMRALLGAQLRSRSVANSSNTVSGNSTANSDSAALGKPEDRNASEASRP